MCFLQAMNNLRPMKAKLVALVSAILATTGTVWCVPQLINFQSKILVEGRNFQGAGEFKFALVNKAGDQAYWSNDGSSVNGADDREVEGTETFTVVLSNASGAEITKGTALVTITDGGPGYDGWAVEQGLTVNAGFSDDASGDGFSNGYHYAMRIPATASILDDHRDLIPRIDPNLFANKATLLFKVPLDFPDDIILDVEETFDMQSWNSIATKDGNADWFFQFPNVVILDAPAEGYRGVGVTSTKTFSQPDPGFYRLRVRTHGIPVAIVDVEPESLPPICRRDCRSRSHHSKIGLSGTRQQAIQPGVHAEDSEPAEE